MLRPSWELQPEQCDLMIEMEEHVAYEALAGTNQYASQMASMALIVRNTASRWQRLWCLPGPLYFAMTPPT
jgi:hypothetical protein